MSIIFRATSKADAAHARGVVFADPSPWNDIPLERAILGIALDGALPAPADWRSSPGDDAGLSAYRSFLSLHQRWVDDRPDADDSIANYLDKAWEQVTVSGNGERELAAEDAKRVLEMFFRAASEAGGDAYAVERSLAHGLMSLCALVSGHTRVERRIRPNRPAASGPIRYLTSQLEGFDRLRRVAVDPDGDALWVEFLSGSKYRIPAELLRKWGRMPGDAGARVRAARVTSKKRRFLVSFGSGDEHEFGAETVLLNCEPRYRADDERDSQREFLADGLKRYGYLRRDRWLEGSST